MSESTYWVGGGVCVCVREREKGRERKRERGEGREGGNEGQALIGI